jgi:hypothetical protein
MRSSEIWPEIEDEFSFSARIATFRMRPKHELNELDVLKVEVRVASGTR